MSYTEHHFRSDDGLGLYYRSYGSGQNTLLCLPGLTRNCKDFEELAEHLAAQWRVITPDVRGRGQSDRDPNPAKYHPGTYVRDTWKLLDELGLDRVAIIGTSLGGLMAMIMADQQPRRLIGLVLNDIGPELPPAAITRILLYAGRTSPVGDWEAAAAQMKQSYGLAYRDMPDEFWIRLARMCYRSNAHGELEPDVDPAIGESLRKAQTLMSVLRTLRRLGLKRRVAGVNIDQWDSFRAVTMPCLLLRGALSDVLTVEIALRMHTMKPEMELVAVTGRGHAPLLNEPEARRAIDRFLNRLLAGGPSGPEPKQKAQW
ncbi:MAG: alpha/beta fold hydrolase [Lysobacterales bacterium]